MSERNDLEEMFKNWNELNQKVHGSFSKFDFSEVKEIRNKQKNIEDAIYENLKENAPKSYREILPSEAGEMEVGYDTEGKKFYYVMIDPKSEEQDSIKLIAFTIDVSKNVNMVEDFKIED
ncbi:MAG: hypothetical protein ACFFBT_13805 [Promethearchaeota archaeon]